MSFVTHRKAGILLPVCLALMLFGQTGRSRSAPAEAPVLPEGARLAIVGDSITEQKLYSKFMETYLLACAGRRDLHIFQFGWGGETAQGFSGRLENDLADFKPTVATLCYGMNDGGYHPFDQKTGQGYEDNMRKVLAGLSGIGVKTVVVGSPGAVDTRFFAQGQKWEGRLKPPAAYNDSLRRLRDIDEKMAADLRMPFVDVHTPMVEAMAKAKAALGRDYDVCGRDGVHPGVNGHLIMAAAFLKTLGCDGDIGEIVVDMKGGAAATPGHKVVGASSGKVDLESERYPFCFDPDAKSSQSTRSILPFFSFNQDLNRLTLKVKNLEADSASVTWGEESKEFPRDRLEAGINLAAEFSRTPFDAPFMKFMQAIGAKQAYETSMIKGIITQLRWAYREFQDDAGFMQAASTLRQKLAARQRQLEEQAHAALVPVQHSLTITARP